MRRYADPDLCPDCQTRLTARGPCPHCGIPLDTPAAALLFRALAQADQHLDWLRAHRVPERVTSGAPAGVPAPAAVTQVAAASTAVAAPLAPSPVLNPAAPAAPSPAGPVPSWSGPTATWQPQQFPAPGRTGGNAGSGGGVAGGTSEGAGERPHYGVLVSSVPRLLLTLSVGLLLLGAAGFMAVTWTRLGFGGQTAILLAATVLAGVGSHLTRARGLRNAGEGLAAVTMGLAALDAWGAVRAGWFGDAGSTALTISLTLVVVGATLEAAHLRSSRTRVWTGIVTQLAVAAGSIGVATYAADRADFSALSLTLAALALVGVAGGLAALSARVVHVVALVGAGVFWVSLVGGAIATWSDEAPSSLTEWWTASAWQFLAAAAVVTAVAVLPTNPRRLRRVSASLAWILVVPALIGWIADDGSTQLFTTALVAAVALLLVGLGLDPRIRPGASTRDETDTETDSTAAQALRTMTRGPALLWASLCWAIVGAYGPVALTIAAAVAFLDQADWASSGATQALAGSPVAADASILERVVLLGVIPIFLGALLPTLVVLLRRRTWPSARPVAGIAVGSALLVATALTSYLQAPLVVPVGAWLVLAGIGLGGALATRPADPRWLLAAGVAAAIGTGLSWDAAGLFAPAALILIGVCVVSLTSLALPAGPAGPELTADDVRRASAAGPLAPLVPVLLVLTGLLAGGAAWAAAELADSTTLAGVLCGTALLVVIGVACVPAARRVPRPRRPLTISMLLTALAGLAATATGSIGYVLGSDGRTDLDALSRLAFGTGAAAVVALVAAWAARTSPVVRVDVPVMPLTPGSPGSLGSLGSLGMPAAPRVPRTEVGRLGYRPDLGIVQVVAGVVLVFGVAYAVVQVLASWFLAEPSSQGAGAALTALPGPDLVSLLVALAVGLVSAAGPSLAHDGAVVTLRWLRVATAAVLGVAALVLLTGLGAPRAVVVGIVLVCVVAAATTALRSGASVRSDRWRIASLVVSGVAVAMAAPSLLLLASASAIVSIVHGWGFVRAALTASEGPSSHEDVPWDAVQGVVALALGAVSILTWLSWAEVDSPWSAMATVPLFVAVTAWWGWTRRLDPIVEIAAPVVALAAVLWSLSLGSTSLDGTPTFSSVSGPVAGYLAVFGALLSAHALLHPSRRRVGWAAALLLAASTWVRLADAGVEVPEAYTAPSAIALLVLGVWQMRQRAGLSSRRALGRGLYLLVLPSLLAVWPDPLSLRGALLAALCLVLIVVGVRLRCSEPLLVGAVAGIVFTLRLGLPVIGSVGPVWVPLVGAGLLVGFLALTWEARTRDVARVSAYLARLR